MTGIMMAMVGGASGVVVTLSPSNWTQSGTSQSMTSPTIVSTVIPSVGPYTYEWDYTADFGVTNVHPLNSADQAFNATLLQPGEPRVVNYTLRVYRLGVLVAQSSGQGSFERSF